MSAGAKHVTAGWGLHDPRVIAAMESVPREEFVAPEWREVAYADRPLPIGYEQTISQPYIVGVMTEMLDPKATDRVLEIGTGSGYQTAVLSRLVADVYSIEIIEPLAQMAAATLRRLGCENVHLRIGDGSDGWPEAVPFDAIIATCAPEKVPTVLVAQLKDGGRLVIPLGLLPDGQSLHLLEKHGDRVVERNVARVRFVPMTGRVQASSGGD